MSRRQARLEEANSPDTPARQNSSSCRPRDPEVGHFTEMSSDVKQWAMAHDINPCTIDKLASAGFVTMSAIRVMQSEDVYDLDIQPRAQQRLLTAAINEMTQPRPDMIPSSNPRLVNYQHQQRATTDTATAAPAANLYQPQQPDRQSPATNSTTAAANSSQSTFADYLQELLSQGESPSLPQVASSTQPLQNILNSQHNPQSNSQNTNLSHFRADLNPMVYMQNHKGEKYADIVDYLAITDNVKEQQVVSTGENGTRLILESASKKPRLESVTPSQWFGANARIMCDLIQKGSLGLGNSSILNYLAYTDKISQLANRFTWTSVLLFDRQYRQLQAVHKFPWGSDIPHLTTITLKEKMPFSSHPAKPAVPSNRADHTKNRPPAPIDTQSGRPICLGFNNGNCKFGSTCTYAHVCLEASCRKAHPKTVHNNQDNANSKN